eukprot:COSAG01_NODE_67173_length_267_cov_176.595238_1_plen_33_part_01
MPPDRLSRSFVRCAANALPARSEDALPSLPSVV